VWKSLVLLVIVTAAGRAQQKPAGVAMDWDVRKQIIGIAQQVRELKLTLSSAKPDEWTKKGAPEAYARQLRATQTLIAYLITAADKVATNPDSMSAALETYFRMQDMTALASSLNEGARKYQSPELAEHLAQELAVTANNRDKLRQYILDLSTTKEQELQIMNEEAQRCRGVISKQSDPPPATRRNRTASNPPKGARP